MCQNLCLVQILHLCNELNSRLSRVPCSPSGEGMTGICNIEPADNISACIWQVQEPQPSEERKDQKPLYHIEF